MFWQKLQHHLMFFFLAFVLLAQSLIFVVSQAVPFKNYELKSKWLSPQNNETLVSGQTITLQAIFEEKNQKIASVYFTLADSSQNLVVNFEAQRAEDNIYSSLVYWNTADWPAGIYSLNARASIINEQGQIIDNQESAPIWVKVISTEEYDNLVAQYIPDTPDELPVSVLGLKDDFGMADALSLDIKDNTLATTSDDTATSIATTTPANNNSTSTVALVPDLALISPENDTTIGSRSFVINFSSNFLSERVSFEFINIDNAAISTRSVSIDKTDGYSWVKSVELDDSFIDGSYKLLISAAIPDSNLLVNKTFDYNLDAPRSIKPEDLFMHLVNLPSNLKGVIGLRAEANLKIDNLDFVIEDTISRVEALRIKGVNDSIPDDQGVVFSALWDTAVLANGNYFIYVQSKIDQTKVGSVKQLVSIFNSKNGELSSSTPEGYVEEQPSGPSTASMPTSTVSVVNSLEPDKASSIDCQRSGITDPILCQKYQADINDSLPRVCIEKNIYKGDDCEKYIFENEANSCLDKEIVDPAKCREYLYQKYSKELVCNIGATSTCQQVISDKYVARLAYEVENKNKFLSLISGLGAKDMTLNSLNDELVVANLGSSNLSLTASDKKIIIAKIKKQNNLDLTENLYFSSPVAIMGDHDSDGLPDDLEGYYQTDANKADSDDDGHIDGQEILNNYNPLGDGKLDKARTALDLALLAKLNIEEPKTSTLVVNDSWSVSSAKASDSGMNFSGKALADTWVNIFIYSDIPFLATTKVDASGAWSYKLTDPMTEGVHQVYIASHDQTGKLLAHSAPLTFVVSNISNDLPPVGVGQQVNVTVDQEPEKNWTIYYIIGASLLLLILFGLLILFIKRRHSEPAGLVSQASDKIVSSNAVSPTKITLSNEEASINLPDSIVVASPEPENNNQENRV